MRSYNKGFKLYIVQLICVLTLGLYQLEWGSWQIETNILSLLPTSSHQQDAAKAKTALFQQANQRVTVAISGERSIAAYRELAEVIKTFDGIEYQEIKLPEISDVIAFYAPYRDSVLTPNYQQLLSSSLALNDFVIGQLTQISNPFVSGSLAIAPRLNLADFLYNGLSSLQSFDTEQGIITVTQQNKTYYIMPIKVDVDGFSVKQTQLFSQQLQDQFARIEQRFQVDLLYSGVLFHTAESSKQAEYEMSTFGVISLLAVLLMILVVFRSAVPVNLAVGVLVIALVYGLTAVVTFFDQLHLLTLVFAVTLIGVVIDYCFHAFVSINENGGLKSIRTALFLGFFTTALGYAALIFSPLILLGQVAVFMIFGLLGALLTVLFLLPSLPLKKPIRVQPVIWQITGKLQSVLLCLNAKRMVISFLLIVILGVTVAVDEVNFNDDIRLLNSSPAALINNEIAMAKLMGYQHSQRIVITAPDSEALLQRQETLLAKLAQQDGLKVKSIGSLLPSVARQQQSNDLLHAADLQQRFSPGLASLGLTDSVDAFKPLTLAAFNEGPLQQLAELYIYQYENKYALWVETSGTPLNTELISWIQEQNDISIDDKPGEVSAALTKYRHALLILFAGAVLVVAIVLCIRFGLYNGLLGLLPILLSAGSALLLTQALLGHLNIFNLLAVLLILALAIDYVIFYQEHSLRRHTVLAITLSAISSALVFGVLALSVTPAVQSFGLTVMLGILFVFILAPLSAPKVTEHNDLEKHRYGHVHE